MHTLLSEEILHMHLFISLIYLRINNRYVQIMWGETQKRASSMNKYIRALTSTKGRDNLLWPIDASGRTEELAIDKPAATINDFISFALNRELTYTEAGGGRNRLPFVCKVCLVSHQHDNDITSSLRSHIINPFCSLLEGVYICERNEGEIANRTDEKSHCKNRQVCDRMRQ